MANNSFSKATDVSRLPSPVSRLTPDSSLLTPHSKIYIAGHRGMVGSAIIRQLKAIGCENIVTRSRAELDLVDQQAVRRFFAAEPVDYVVAAAAKVGGIHANNTYPAEFIYQNLMVEANLVHEAWRAGIKHLLFLGSSCIYPKHAPQPMREEHLLTGPLEPTNEPYAIAKIAGIKLCEAYNRQYGTDYRSVMPTNLYGPGDNYHLENSHVIPAMIRKFHLAKLVAAGDLDAVRRDELRFGTIPEELKKVLGIKPYIADQAFDKKPGIVPTVEIWGTGKARREFLHVDDMAAACVHIMGLAEQAFYSALSDKKTDVSHLTSYVSPSFLNIGSNQDQTIAETAALIQRVVGFKGAVVYDRSKPDGTPQKLMDSSRLNSLGWQPKFSFEEGLRDAYRWYLEKGGRQD